MTASAIIYRGPSVLDGEPIAAILTGMDGRSANPKTGPMAQLWIIREDVHPVEAVQQGTDSSVCGECPLRSLTGARRCYVNVGQAPSNVWRALQRGSYPHWDGAPLNVPVRLGAYGDPAAVPYGILRTLTAKAPGWTGYTHQWVHPRFDPRILKLCSASVDKRAQIAELPKGARYFRVRPPGDKRLKGEMDCPSNRGVTCADCQACNGSSGKGRSVSIDAHGGAGVMSVWQRERNETQ